MAEIEYETHDVSVRWAVKAGAAFLALALFGGGVCLGVYALLVRIHAREERPAAPLAQAPGRLPPVPRLQSRPQSDLAELRAQHLRELTTYGWVNQQAGTTHIDIEEAMRLYAARAAGATGAAGAAPARLDIPPEAAGPAGTPTMPAVAPTPGASASPAARPHP